MLLYVKKGYLMARDIVDLTPIESIDELIAWISAGIKPISNFKIGTEHEKIPFYADTLKPVPYEGTRGIRALLLGLQAINGWDAIMEGENIIGLADAKGGGAISLEPGGQFELSGAPLNNIHQTLNEAQEHLTQLKQLAAPLGIRFLSLGASPKWTLQETPIMPKARYNIMANYMPKVGSHGLDMMFRTSTVQVNLDFSSEADMVKKLRVSLALQPIATALFANSPFTSGKLNGFKSFRSEIWRDTDNQRAGMLPFAFEDGMGFERYVEYALNVPMYFLKRGDTYHDVTGASFRDLMNGKFQPLPNEKAYMSDWANHLGTIFPEVRLKRYLEMRGGDVGPLPMIAAFSAFWTGLLYNQDALNAAWDIAKHWSVEQRQALRDDVPKLALQAKVAGRSVLEIARELLEMSTSGLKARAILNHKGQDETIYLSPLYGQIDAGKTQADALIELFHMKLQGNIEPVFKQCIY
jgi:glutamate--cysteine ligase